MIVMVLFLGFFGFGVYYMYDLVVHILYTLEFIYNSVRIDFIMTMAQTFFEIFSTLIVLLANLGYFFASNVFGIAIEFIKFFSTFLPTFFRILKDCIACSAWIFQQLWRGLTTRDNNLLSSLSWTMVVCSFFLYIQRLLGFEDRNGLNRNSTNGNNRTNRRLRTNPNINQEQPNVRRQNLYPDLTEFLHERPDPDVRVAEEYPERNTQLRNNLRENGNNSAGNGNVQSDNICIVCMENPISVATFPCGHVHLCSGCILQIMQRNKLCPTCQTRIREHRRVFL